VDGASFPGGSFVVERSQTGTNGVYSVIGSTSADSVLGVYTFTDSAPGSTVTDTYRVRAITSGGSTAYSGTAQVVIP
jgi:hypothetical protein